MAELRALCERAGFTEVVTYIQSGNVIFHSAASEAKVRAILEPVLAKKLGKPVEVLVRVASELRTVLRDNPFPDAPPNRVIVFFLESAPEPGALAAVVAPTGEQLAARGRHVFVHYPLGQGVSKLRAEFLKTGTGRNLNSVRKILELVEAVPSPE
jgi:uncharacterized protein (DUF1697 family)